MSRQHHDPGNKKRTAREHAAATQQAARTPDDYARDLVRRGLAPASILDDAGHGRTHGGGRQ